jgi:hypothetical protein
MIGYVTLGTNDLERGAGSMMRRRTGRGPHDGMEARSPGARPAVARASA